jgi:DNA-binding GntR family transcriptional regulator
MLLPIDAKLRRSSTSDEIVAILRESIVSGQLAPGTQLREVALAEELGVSRPTLREALRSLQLQGDGLVRHRTNRGVFVSDITADEVDDIYRVRAVLESNGARACAKAVPAQRETLAAAFAALRASWDGGDLPQLIDADLGFHRAIVALLGSPRLDAVFAGTCDGLKFCLSVLSTVAPEGARGPDAREQHAAIFAALMAPDPATAARLVTRHIDDNWERIVGIVRQRETVGAARAARPS